ncbi:LCP family protein [Paenibacillus sp. sptzw28]|uniref:LCP family glycopolymer transferase n=1 Tax=Paenibacillus sp. sptzw28 TaxID=715179 RepID=UPI001C6F4D3F|nr:LCP family protein [Paenibacillus sp. sptzw28]QYR20602.1 LCP family protein [Paenibacillus sp. sptzw28]
MKLTWKKIILRSGIAAIAILLCVLGYVWYLYNSVQQVSSKMYQAIDKPVYAGVDPEVAAKPVVFKNRDPFTVLVLGVDQRNNDRGRSDTMILLTVNPAKKSILMFNIPRDTRTEIVGHGTMDKINHAYAFGDAEMSIRTVERFLDYPIDYYIKVNMEGFARLIDSVGGVEVDNPFAFNYEGHQFDKGHLTLSGSEALLYSRMRYDDPRGDLGRNARQRDILQGIMRNSMTLTNLTRIRSLLNEVGDSVKTDFTFSDLKTLITDYRPDIDKISTIEIKGKGQTIGGIWYYIVDDAERSRIHQLIKEHIQQ